MSWLFAFLASTYSPYMFPHICPLIACIAGRKGTFWGMNYCFPTYNLFDFARLGHKDTGTLVDQARDLQVQLFPPVLPCPKYPTQTPGNFLTISFKSGQVVLESPLHPPAPWYLLLIYMLFHSSGPICHALFLVILAAGSVAGSVVDSVGNVSEIDFHVCFIVYWCSWVVRGWWACCYRYRQVGLKCCR